LGLRCLFCVCLIRLVTRAWVALLCFLSFLGAWPGPRGCKVLRIRISGALLLLGLRRVVPFVRRWSGAVLKVGGVAAPGAPRAHSAQMCSAAQPVLCRPFVRLWSGAVLKAGGVAAPDAPRASVLRSHMRCSLLFCFPVLCPALPPGVIRLHISAFCGFVISVRRWSGAGLKAGGEAAPDAPRTFSSHDHMRCSSYAPGVVRQAGGVAAPCPGAPYFM
jgi:hypothetical protein